MPDLRIPVATRASALARAQTGWVRERIESVCGQPTSEVLVTSQGDVSQAALTSFGGQGVFVTEVRAALFDGRADVAVHSMKDMPTADDPGTVIAVIPQRENAFDFVVSSAATLDELPERAKVATGSPRRAAFLRRARPDLRIVDIRGNVDTRVAKVRDGEVDAVVVAVAGLHRLGLEPPGFELDPETMLPAVGQGALGVQTRAGDPLVAALSAMDCVRTRSEVIAERALLAGLRAGCAAPVGARAQSDGDIVELRAAVLSQDGSKMYECVVSGPAEHAARLGRRAAENLIGQGADRLLGENR